MAADAPKKWDDSRGAFARIPHLIADALTRQGSAAAWTLAIAILRRVDRTTWITNPLSDEMLAEETGLHPGTIARAIKVLGRCGIQFNRGRCKGDASIYWVPCKSVIIDLVSQPDAPKPSARATQSGKAKPSAGARKAQRVRNQSPAPAQSKPSACAGPLRFSPRIDKNKQERNFAALPVAEQNSEQTAPPAAASKTVSPEAAEAYWEKLPDDERARLRDCAAKAAEEQGIPDLARMIASWGFTDRKLWRECVKFFPPMPTTDATGAA